MCVADLIEILDMMSEREENGLNLHLFVGCLLQSFTLSN